MMEASKKTYISAPLDREEKKVSLSIIPLSSKKVPTSAWKQYQMEFAPVAHWLSHYQSGNLVGLICGKVSGNLECLDIDMKHDPQKTIMDEFNRLIPSDLRERMILQKTPSGGFHYIYRCPEAIIDGNQRLALNKQQEAIIETRGEGGYVATGLSQYKILKGNLKLHPWNVDIPEITKQERDFLLETARSLTRYFPPVKSTKSGEPFRYQEEAINDFNQQFSAIDLFEKHGWEVVNQDGDKYYLLRDGSQAAHSGYYFKETKTFFCFSTSTPFKPQQPYNNFQILKILEGEDDFQKTKQLLPTLGFEITTPKEITAEDIAECLNSMGVRHDTFIQDLTMQGKVLEEIDNNTLFINLKKKLHTKLPRSKFEETIKSHYIATINPLIDFIEEHKERKPTGIFNQWLDCMKLRNKSVEREVVLHFLKKWYVGMIAQALDGEYPNEFFLCLLSTEQGIGKTTLLRRYTLPEQLHQYRKEHSLSYDDDFKVLMGQSLLIIDDEMDGRTYEADKTFKTVLSTMEVTMRRKYDRRISTIKRRSSFAGSGNHLQVVRERNNRRIIPIEVEEIYFDRLPQIDYVDLFMEAYHLFKSGYKYSFQREDIALLPQIYSDYVLVSDVEMILDEYIVAPQNENDTFLITNLDLINTLIHEFPSMAKRINAMSVGKLMHDRGFRSIRKGKNRESCYLIGKNSKMICVLHPDANTWGLHVQKYKPLGNNRSETRNWG